MLGGDGGLGRRVLPEGLQEIRDSAFTLGGRTLSLVANPVLDEDGRALGTTLEWTDKTQEVAVEQEIDTLVDAARNGNLEQRIELAGKTGFHRQLGAGFNSLLDELSSVFDAIAGVMAYVAEGDLRHSIEDDFPGRFDQVNGDINRTLRNLDDTVARLNGVAGRVDAAADEIAAGNENLRSRTEQ